LHLLETKIITKVLGTSSIKISVHMRQKRSFFIHFLKVKFYILPIFINLRVIIFKITRKFKIAPYNLHSTISAKNRTFSDFAKSKNATFLTNIYHFPFDSHQLLNIEDSLVYCTFITAQRRAPIGCQPSLIPTTYYPIKMLAAGLVITFAFQFIKSCISVPPYSQLPLISIIQYSCHFTVQYILYSNPE